MPLVHFLFPARAKMGLPNLEEALFLVRGVRSMQNDQLS